jgi:glucose/arabinose dehydrogenase
MLRIDIEGDSPGAAANVCGKVTVPVDPNNPDGPQNCNATPRYRIPAANPFVASDGFCDEIWAYGLRNPWRWSFDRSTHDLLIGDVGENDFEEIDLQPATSGGGENYGWSCQEGNETVDYHECRAGDTLIDPIFSYDHEAGDCSVTGGYRYRGHYQPLQGTYFYADFCTGRIWSGDDSGGVWSDSLWRDTNLRISSFGEDDAGELYLASVNGAIYRIATPPPPPPPANAIFGDQFESP